MQPINGLSLIVAMTADRIIGRNNTLPWRIPSDLWRLKKLTTGHPIITGRKNWESIPEKSRLLPGRTNIVLTRQASYRADDAMIVNSVEQAYQVAIRAPGAEEIFVIGGEDIYRQFLPFVKKAHITTVHASVTGDTYFPYMGANHWLLDESTVVEGWPPDDEYPTSFKVLKKQDE